MYMISVELVLNCDPYTPEAIVLGFRLPGTGNFFGIDQVSRAPVALDKSPRAGHVNRVPTVSKSVVLEANARLIPGRFAVTLYDHAMQSCVAAKRGKNVVGYDTLEVLFILSEKKLVMHCFRF